jgi:hypothetical protein
MSFSATYWTVIQPARRNSQAFAGTHRYFTYEQFSGSQITAFKNLHETINSDSEFE